MVLQLSQKTGLPLKIAGPITDQKYFDEQVKPHIDSKQIEYLGRYGEDRIRKIAKRLKADLVRAA